MRSAADSGFSQCYIRCEVPPESANSPGGVADACLSPVYRSPGAGTDVVSFRRDAFSSVWAKVDVHLDPQSRARTDSPKRRKREAGATGPTDDHDVHTWDVNFGSLDECSVDGSTCRDSYSCVSIGNTTVTQNNAGIENYRNVLEVDDEDEILSLSSDCCDYPLKEPDDVWIQDLWFCGAGLNDLSEQEEEEQEAKST